MKNVFELYKLNSPLPVLRAEIQAQECLALIDTGSELNLIDTSFAKAHKIKTGKPVDIHIAGVQTDCNVKKTFSENVTLKDRHGVMCNYEMTGIIADMPQLREYFANICDIPLAMIVGIEWLNQHNAVINTEEQTLLSA